MAFVVIRFTSDVSIYPGTLLSALSEDIYGDYNPADGKCGYSASPKSPEIAEEIRVWSLNIKRLYKACYRTVWALEKKFNREIPVEIKIEGGN